MGTGSLQIETVVDRVYAILRERVLAGEIQGGTRLRQEALAEELGVSRTPLREALRRLAAEGLVEFNPNRGAQVTEVTRESSRASYEARLVIEPGAARLAAARRSAAEVARMRDAVAAERASMSDAEAYAASRDFHLALVAASGNEHLKRVAEALWVSAIGQPIFSRQASLEPERITLDVVEHERIVRAVDAGDADVAEALTRSHIAAAFAHLLEAI
jgi:DNA-binding GntR family transcriptional regulator